MSELLLSYNIEAIVDIVHHRSNQSKLKLKDIRGYDKNRRARDNL